MYEYEFYNKAINEHFFFYGHSFKDLEKRYPEVDFSELTYLCRDYID